MDGPGNLTDAVRVAADPGSRKPRREWSPLADQGPVAAHQAGEDSHQRSRCVLGATWSGVGERLLGWGSLTSARLPSTAGGGSIRTFRRGCALIPVITGRQWRATRPVRSSIVRRCRRREATAAGTARRASCARSCDRWLDAGKPVVLASRCIGGEVSATYAFPGGGGRPYPAGSQCRPDLALPSQARMELADLLVGRGGVRGG